MVWQLFAAILLLSVLFCKEGSCIQAKVASIMKTISIVTYWWPTISFQLWHFQLYSSPCKHKLLSLWAWCSWWTKYRHRVSKIKIKLVLYSMSRYVYKCAHKSPAWGTTVQYCGGCAVLWGYISTMEGYHQYYGGISSVLWRDIISTVEDIQCFEGNPQAPWVSLP